MLIIQVEGDIATKSPEHGDEELNEAKAEGEQCKKTSFVAAQTVK